MKKSLMALTLLFALYNVGCANSGTDLAPTPPGIPIVPGPGGASGIPAIAANEVALTIDSTSILTDFANYPAGNPTDVRVKVAMSHIGQVNNTWTYTGDLTVSYQDNGYYISNRFTAGSDANDAQYNYWFTSGGNSIFHAFFEDIGRGFKRVTGGVVLVIDGNNDMGDGGTEVSLSGSVWFLNFEPSGAPQADKRCWFVSLGPYDCRAFLVNNQISPTSRIYPEMRQLSTGYQPGYKRLGTFTGLKLNEAFK